MNKKNILIISHVDSLGGAERVLLNTIKSIEENYNVFVFINKRGDKNFSKKLKDKEKYKTLNFGLIQKSYFRTILEVPLTVNSLVKTIKFIKKNNIDLIYSNTSVNILGILAAKLTKKRHFWHIHEQFGGVFNAKFRKIYKSLMKYNKNYNIYISNIIKNNWEENIEGIKYIPNTIIRNPIMLKSEDNNINSIKEDVVIGFAGSIVKNKNLVLILNAINDLKKDYKNLKLMIAGEGYLKKDMMKYCIKNNLTEIVTFLGNVDDMNKFYEKIDILILPSFTEGVPLVVLEAAVKGKMIILTKNSGINEILVENEDYMSINPNDYNDLNDKLRLILNNNDIIKKYGNNSFKTINEYLKKNDFKESINKILS